MRKIHENAVDIYTNFLSNKKTDRLFDYLREVCSEFSCPPNVTPYIIHETLQSIAETNDLKANITKENYESKVKDFRMFLDIAGLIPDYYNDSEAEGMSRPFEQYVSRYIKDLPEGKDLTIELLTVVYFYLLGVSDSEDSEIIVRSPTLKELNVALREKANYSSLLDEYDEDNPQVEDDSILKSVEPVDVSNLPEYVIDGLYLHKGKYYRPSEVRKMITASSQTAQALEREDLEDENTELGLSAEELGRKYIKKLKLRKEKKDES